METKQPQKIIRRINALPPFAALAFADHFQKNLSQLCEGNVFWNTQFTNLDEFGLYKVSQKLKAVKNWLLDFLEN